MNFSNPVFLDSAPIIYFVEQQPEFGEKTKKIFAEIIKNSTPIFSSHITLAEVLIKPLQKNDLDLTSDYHQFFKDLPNFNFINYNHSTAILTAQIRAKYKFRFADSANLALALESNCKTFLTNDDNLKNFPDLKVLLISDRFST